MGTKFRLKRGVHPLTEPLERRLGMSAVVTSTGFRAHMARFNDGYTDKIFETEMELLPKKIKWI